MVVTAVAWPAAVGFAQMCRRLEFVQIRGRHTDGRRIAADTLQVTLADESGVVARRAHDFDEGSGVERQRYTVLARAVERRHAAGHEGCPVGHADRRGDVKIFKARAAVGQPVDARRAHDLVAVTAEMIGAVLIGDDE